MSVVRGRGPQTRAGAGERRGDDPQRALVSWWHGEVEHDREPRGSACGTRDSDDPIRLGSDGIFVLRHSDHELIARYRTLAQRVMLPESD